MNERDLSKRHTSILLGDGRPTKRKSCAHCMQREGRKHLDSCGFIVLGAIAPGVVVGFRRDGTIRKK